MRVRPKPNRRINGNLASGQADKSEVSNTVEQSHARQIYNLPSDQREIVISSIREGIKNDAITSYFMEQGWLSVTEKSFKQYLIAFKRIYADLIRGQGEVDPRAHSPLDVIIDPRRPDLDEETHLQQLIRVNSLRIKKGVDFELETGIVNKDLHKDIQTSRDLVEALASLRGKTRGAGRPSQNNQPVSNNALEQLRKSDAAEAAQDRLANLVGSLGPLLAQVHNGKAA